ncbi:zinc finger protein RFP-like isoform X2 [Tiliqua scincoides]|uniref:zinc finger protein RFP-like isoform X2 n=1 Tax=Tiliqua scincoides TaxID=71010 RepID=UPI003462C96A
MATAGSVVKQFCEETTCPICLDYFTDPVITKCGHNFCRACLTQSSGELDRNASCPQCRNVVQPNSLRPNRQLANIVEITKKYSVQVTRRAETLCEMHEEPLKLFCRDDEAPICVVCDRSKEHREHRVILVEEAAKEYKKQLKAEKQEIMSIVEQMHKYLQEKELFWLKQLVDLGKEIKRRQDENMMKLAEEISHFSHLIKDVELQCQQPPSKFLQDIRHTLSRCQESRARELDLSPGLEWRLRSNSPKISVLHKAMKDLEGSLREALIKVSVTLDPGTAHPQLVLSEDLKSVMSGNHKQNLPYSPERFNALPCVLGRERFTSGRHCWEVEVKVEKVKERGWWAVGVARESLRRKGWICLSLPEGIWAVGKDSSHPHEVLAYTSPLPTPVALRGELKKIRVFLDYEEGHVEFFDADTDRFIFSFPPDSLSGEGLRPFFWVQEGVCIQCCILRKIPTTISNSCQPERRRPTQR